MAKILQKLSVATLSAALSFAAIEANPAPSDAAVIYNGTGLSDGSRWDAAPRTINGNERSLDGGLRYSLQGGSYEAYRDLFSWQGDPPSVPEFQNAVEGAFNAWTVVDPISGLGTELSFITDFGTTVVGTGSGYVNTDGAEIDLLAAMDAGFWDPQDPNQQGETYFRSVKGGVTLTSGTAGYSGEAILGADLTLNNNPQALYSLDFFQLLLTHEIGHALGLGDVEFGINPGIFIDDNFDGSDRATALATLTNSWAGLVDPFNPAASPLSLFDVQDADPGVDTPGVDILMESFIPDALIGDPTSLRNDDYGGRQFLYPVPEPSSAFGLLVFGALGAGSVLKRKKKKPSALKHDFSPSSEEQTQYGSV